MKLSNKHTTLTHLLFFPLALGMMTFIYPQGAGGHAEGGVPYSLQQHPNLAVRFLNKVQYQCSQLWEHSERKSVPQIQDITFVPQENGRHFLEQETDQEMRARKRKIRKQFSTPRVGHWVEGLGELADICSLTSTNPKTLRLANSLALLCRMTDVACGSFPQVTPDPYNRLLGLRFWPHDPENAKCLKGKTVRAHVATLAANQLGKAWDMVRAGERIKHAKLIAWYNKKHVSAQQRKKLNLIQAIHATVLIGCMVAKAYQQNHNVEQRYPWLIAEATISLIRRLHIRHVQSKMLNDAHDEWAIRDLQD